jgi:hypothetical protein
MTIVFEYATRTSRSIQVGTPAAASGSMPLACSQGVVLSAISRTSTLRSLARTSASAIGADQDLALGVVNRAGRERCAVAFNVDAKVSPRKMPEWRFVVHSRRYSPAPQPLD